MSAIALVIALLQVVWEGILAATYLRPSSDEVSMRRFEGEFGCFWFFQIRGKFFKSVEILAKWGEMFAKSGENCCKISGKFKIRGNFSKNKGIFFSFGSTSQ